MRLKLTLQYNGSDLHGWQYQRPEGNVRGVELPTVEGHLMRAWEALTGETGRDWQAAGRTDAGVHALGMVVHVDTDWPHAGVPLKVMDGLNHFLPPTVRVVRVSVVADDFHARFLGCARHYRYVLFNGRIMRPDWLGRAGHERRALDVGRIREALACIPLGAHDFSGFRDAECQSHDRVCHLLRREVLDMGEGFIQVEISANRFLQHMVRNMVGTLVECALVDDPHGRYVARPVEDMVRVLNGRDRTLAGKTYPPDGLYFLGVDYMPHEEHSVVG